MTPEGILQYCLEEVGAGRLTIAECVTRFPQVDDLAEQLAVAGSLAAMPKHETSLRPSAAWQADLQRQMRKQAEQGRLARRPLRFGWLVRWTMAVAICLLPAWAGVGVVSAAANSLPGDALYGVKRSAEGAWLALTPGSRQAGLHLTLAETRASELFQVAGRATTPLLVIETLTSEMLRETDSALAEIESAADGQRTVLLAQTLVTLEHQQATLVKVKALMPSAGQASIDECLEVTQAQLAYTEQEQQQAVAALAGASSTEPVRATAGAPLSSATVTAVGLVESPTASPTPSLTMAALSATPSLTPTQTATASPSPTSTANSTPSMSPSPTATATQTATPTETVTPTVTSAPPTVIASATPTQLGQAETPTPVATDTATATSPAGPTETPTPTDLPVETPTPTPTPTETPMPTDTASPTATPTVELTATATPPPDEPEGF